MISIVVAILLFNSDINREVNDDIKLFINECEMIFYNVFNVRVPSEVDSVIVQHLAKTSHIGFSRGSLGGVGEFSRDYQPFLSCTIINSTREVISLSEPGVKLYLYHDTPEQRESADHYVGKDKEFDLFLYSYNEGEVSFVEHKKYTNDELYEYLYETIDFSK